MSVLDQFRKLKAVKVEAVTTGGETFHVRMISAREATDFHEYQAKKTTTALQAMTRLVATALCNADGTKVEVKDADLEDLHISNLLELFQAACRFNKLDGESSKAAEGNSQGAKSASSPSA